jgi:acyl dehydratase
MTQTNATSAERLWTYEAVRVGQNGGETQVTLTAENIAEYAACAQNPDPRYAMPAPGQDSGPLLAMPTMALTYAPLLRDEIAEANGFVAQERSETNRRQTPFAKCEMRWYRPVRSGETLTGTRRVHQKYERRGSKFVTFRVSAFDEAGAVVASYDYTCIFEYSAGQRSVPDPSSEAPPPADVSAVPDPTQFLTWENASAGTPLPRTLSVGETTENILRKNAQRLAGRPSESNIHTDEEFARQNIFGGAVNAGPATMSYVDRFIGLNVPPEALYNGGNLVMRAITPFRAGDVVTFSGAVIGTGGNLYGQRKVQCRIRGVNQRDELVCLSDAALSFG